MPNYDLKYKLIRCGLYYFSDLCWIQTNQGTQNLTAERAKELTGIDPDYAIRDLYNAIAEGNYVSNYRCTINLDLIIYIQSDSIKSLIDIDLEIMLLYSLLGPCLSKL